MTAHRWLSTLENLSSSSLLLRDSSSWILQKREKSSGVINTRMRWTGTLKTCSQGLQKSDAHSRVSGHLSKHVRHLINVTATVSNFLLAMGVSYTFLSSVFAPS